MPGHNKPKRNRRPQPRPFRPRPRSSGNYWSALSAQYSLPVVLFGFFIVLFGVVIITSIQNHAKKFDRDIVVDMHETMQRMIEKNTDMWNLRYSEGYRLVTIDGKGAVFSGFNSLPRELTMNWQEVSFVPVDPKEAHENPGVVKVNFPKVTYLPAKIFSRAIMVQILPREGERTVLFDTGQERLVFDVLEASQNKVIGILGLW